MSTLYASSFTTLQDAINAAAAGDTIIIDSGTYSGDLTIDKALTLVGANAGVPGTDGDRNDETNIIGQINVTAAAGTVTIDGVRVENASNNATQQFGINVTGAADVRVQNSILHSDGPNGGNAGGWGDVAVFMGTGATGHVYIQSNLIDGAGTDHYSNASWNRGIFAQSDATTLTVLNNTINNVRTGIGSQGVSSGDVIERNHINDAGTGASLSYDLSLGRVDKNFYDHVDTEYNFRSATSGVTYNATNPTNTHTNTNGAVVILGGDHNDNLTGTSGDDYIAGDASNGAGDGLLFGAGTADNDGNILSGLGGNDTLLGSTGKDSLNGGAGNDTLKGGDGVDTAVFSGAMTVSNVTYDATNHVWTANGGADGTDTLAKVEVVDGNNAGRILLVDPNGDSGFATIQAAIDAAQAGDTIVLAAGTYVEQVKVDGKSDLTIMALPGADVTIQAPADVHDVATSSSGRAVNSVVAVLNSSNITLENINIDGNGAGNSVDGSNANFVGVYYRNASGGLENVDITGIHDAYPGGTTVDGFPIQSGNQRGVGLQVDNDSLLSFFMHGGSIADFQKNGTVIRGADLDFTGVHISGGGIQAISQNGLQVLNSTGIINSNTIDHMGSDAVADGSYATGVLAYGNTDLTINGNTIIGANGDGHEALAHVIGIYSGDFGTPNSGGSISGNTLSYVDNGIDVEGGLISPIAIGHNYVDNLDTSDPYADGLYYAPATDTPSNIQGTIEADHLYGNSGDDVFQGGGGNDHIEGGDGSDTLDGGNGNDDLYGGAGADIMMGSDGDDTYHDVDGADTIYESALGGTDTVVTAVSYTLGANVENLTLIDGPATAVETFEEFATGAVDNGENGWSTSGSHDQGIVDLGGSHGKVFRMSSDPSSGDFGGPYSVPLSFATGETGTSAAYSSQTISFDFKPVSNAAGDSSRLEVDLGNTSATDRANFMVIETTASGVRIAVAAPDATGDFGDSGSFPADWTELVSGLDASTWHHIDLKVQYNDGADNDVIQVWVDGVMVGTTTTFENYHDASGGTHEGNAEANQTNSLFFRAGNNGQPADGAGGQNQGFYFDNLSGSNVDGTGNDLANVITGNAGNNVLTGAGGNDTLAGGGGVDTAHYSTDIAAADVSYDATNHVWTVSAGAEGTDTLSHVEVVDGGNAGRILLVDPDGTGFASIQAAIDAASAGDTIVIAAGTYNENVNVNKAGVTLLGQGDVTIHGTFASDNHVTGDLHTFMNGATAYSGAAGDGINIAASNVTISNINIEGFLHAVNFGADVSNVTLTDVDMAHNVIGIEKATTADVDHLTVTDGSISDGYIGIDFAKATGPSGIGNGIASHITIDGTAFNDLSNKGIYVETLTDSLITGVSMDNVGQYGGSASFGANGRTGNGIDLNLKAGTYQGIVIEDFTLHNVGASNGLGASNINGGAIVIEARSDPSYASAPGIVTDTIIVRNGTITGTTSTGIQVGEPGKGNADPDVSVSNVTINGALHSGTFGDVTNETQSTLTVHGTADGDSVYTGANSIGAIVFDGGAGNDSFTGHNEVDTASYSVALSVGAFVYNGGTDSWTVNAGAEGTDTLKGVDKVTDSTGHTYLLVGNGGYATLQAAVNAAAAGDIILVAAGTFNGDVTVDKAVTIVGVNHGVDASGARVSESIVNGQITVTAASGNVVIDGLYVLNSSSNSVHQDGVAVTGAANVTVENTVLHSAGGNAAFGIGPWGDVAFYVGTGATGHITLDHNLIDGGGTGSFSGASWARAMQTETDASVLTITNNVITGNRSGLGFAGLSASDTVTGNTFNANGTAIAAGLGLDFSGVTGNTLNGNFDDFNVRTATGHVSLDLSTQTIVNAGPDGYVKVLGGNDNDVLTGSAGDDFLTADASTNSDGLNFGAGSSIIDDNTLYGMGGNDFLYGSQGVDTLDGGQGNDTLAGGDGVDVAVFHASVGVSAISYDAGTHKWTVASATEGTDNLSKVETVSDGTHRYLLVDPNGDSGFASIQAAVDAAHAGDIIILAAGTYSGNVTVDKAVTILGANHGMSGTDTRGAESTIDGQITVSASAGNVVVDGVYILNDSDNNTQQDGVAVTGAANVTVENSVIHSQGINANFGQGPWGDVAVYIGTAATGHITLDHNLIDGGGTGAFSTASWARALQTETDATVLTITNNTVTGNRSGLGLAGLSANDSITGNTLSNNGTAFAAGLVLNLSGFTGNTITGNYDEYNLRTASAGVTFDALSQSGNGGPGGYVTILGSDLNDTLSGTNGDDFISADASTNSDGLNFGAGSATVDNNTLNGRGGDDILYGSQGVDTLNGGDGNDTLDGGAGNDVMSGGAGNDTYYVDSTQDNTSETVGGFDAGGIELVYASADFTLKAFFENLTLTGTAALNGTGNDLANIIIGNSGANILKARGGNDLIDGGAGNDILYGGSGDDTYIVDSTADLTREYTTLGTDDGGHDLVLSSVNWTLVDYFEDLTLTGTADLTGTGNALNNVITGNSGANLLKGNAGNDTIDGGAGDDNMRGGSGDDTYYVDSTKDIAREDTTLGVDDGGHDLVISSATFTLGAFIEDLTLTGTAANKGTGNSENNVLTGNAANNTLSGQGGNDALNGGGGTDKLYGGAGNDTYYIDSAADTASEQTVANVDDGGIDTVYSSVNWTLDTFIENLFLTGTTVLNGTGNDSNNRLTGNQAANTLKGLAGNDVIDGGAGNDKLYGGAGNDTYYVDASGDQVSEETVSGVDDTGTDLVHSSVSYTLGNFIENLTLTGTAISGTGNALNNLITGNDQANTLFGNDGDDVLDGGAGADNMRGGAGNDTYIVDDSNDIVNEKVTGNVDAGGTDLVLASASFTLSTFVDNLTLTGSGNINGTGNTGDNTIIGNSGNNILNGGAGRDLLTGGTGADTFVADKGHDYILDFNSGQGDMIDVSAYTHGVVKTNLIFQDGVDVIINFGGANILTINNATYNDPNLLSHIIW